MKQGDGVKACITELQQSCSRKQFWPAANATVQSTANGQAYIRSSPSKRVRAQSNLSINQYRYSYNPNGGPPMMSPSMGPGQYPSQHMRPQPGYYGQQPISQMPPPAMQKTPSSVASAAPMGIPNGMPPMMMQQQGMGQMPTSTAGSTMSMNNQMKSPMPGPNMPGSMTMRQTTTPQMNSPGYVSPNF